MLRVPVPVFAAKFIRDAILGTDNPPLTFLPILAPPIILPIFPTELVIRWPRFPNIGDTPIPGTELRLPPVPELEDIPGIEPPIEFMPLLNAGFPTTPIPPLLVTPECPCGICVRQGSIKNRT